VEKITDYGVMRMKKVVRPKKLEDITPKDSPVVEQQLETNVEAIKKELTDCNDVVFRSLVIENRKATVVYVDGLIDRASQELHGLHQLLTSIPIKNLTVEYLEQQILSVNHVLESTKIDDLIKKVLEGNTILLVDQLEKALVLDVKGGQNRGVAEPETEASIRGPREGFTEQLGVNTSLIRKKIRSKHLKLVSKEIGAETKTGVVVMYMDNLAPENLVKEVFSRLDKIKIDGVLESGYIEEFIEDNPWSFFPQMQNTERPDTVAANLLEGRIIILVDGTPFALILPVSFWQFLQASEDYYQRFHISIFLRILRITFIFLALLLPAFYVAVTTYHQEMIPTNLLFSIAASREAIPFPVFIEALIMEIAFEALREAGVRLPKVVGQSVSILGALVIGQAAVEAGIVSAPMVIIVSMTGIASFTIPRFNMAISIRLLRFPMMVLGGSFGLLGIVLGSIIILTHLCKLTSLGIPYFSPLGPLNWSELKDVFIRAPWWALKKRPTEYVSGNVIRQKN